MNALEQMRQAGQSLWLDNITRTLLDNGGLQRYIDEYGVTGLTSNPSIFHKAITGSGAYREAIDRSTAADAEALFFELAIDDLRRAADLFAPAHQRTQGVDGWVSLEVSPLLADDARATAQAAIELHRRAGRANLFIKIPGNAAGCTAIEEATAAGVPINVTLLFSARQLLASAEAWRRGIERRIASGKDPHVSSVLSLFVSRWDVAVAGKLPAELHNRLGIAVAGQAYREYLDLLESPRWKHLPADRIAPQRLLWASTGTKDPNASPTLYADALVAPDTIDTLPEQTLDALAAHGQGGAAMPRDGIAAAAELKRFTTAGIDIDALAERLQQEGKQAFDRSWHELMAALDAGRPRRSAAGSGGAGR